MIGSKIWSPNPLPSVASKGENYGGVQLPGFLASFLPSFLPSSVPLFLILRSIRPTCGVVKRTLSLTTLSPFNCRILPTCWRIPGEQREDGLNIRLRFRFRGCQVRPAVAWTVKRSSVGHSVSLTFLDFRRPEILSTPLLFSVDCFSGIRRACGRGTEIAAEDAVAAVRESPPANVPTPPPPPPLSRTANVGAVSGLLFRVTVEGEEDETEESGKVWAHQGGRFRHWLACCTNVHFLKQDEGGQKLMKHVRQMSKYQLLP